MGTHLSAHFSVAEALGEVDPGDATRANAAALASQLEILRHILGGKPLESRAWWVPGPGLHPEGDAHAAGLAADLVPPPGTTVDALAHHAHLLGFRRVVKLEGGLVHVEIPAPGEGPVPQEPLTRVARMGMGPRLDRPAVHASVDAHTPLASALASPRGAEIRALVLSLAGLGDIVARRLVVLLGGAVASARARGVDPALFLGVTVQEGAGNPRAYRSEGPHWHRRNITSGKLFDVRAHPSVVDYPDPRQWGSAGAWQMLRSTAISMGFPAETRWATKLTLHATRETDEPTGQPRGAETGVFEGPFADPVLAADYTARLLADLRGRAVGKAPAGQEAKAAVAAYNAGWGNVLAAIRAVEFGPGDWFAELPRFARNDAAKEYAPRVLRYAEMIRPALVDIERAGPVG